VYTARNSIFDWNVSGEDLASAIVGPPAMFIPTLVLLLLVVAFLEVSPTVMKPETSYEWQIIEHPYLVMCICVLR
jgi:hypothetical protein